MRRPPRYRAARPAFAARALIFATGLAGELDDVACARRDILAAVRLAEVARSTVLLVNARTVGAAAIMAKRGAPAAVAYVNRAFALQDPAAESDLRLAALANAARIAWHIGDDTAASRYPARARWLLDGAPRIAQVQLACAVADIAFTEADSTRRPMRRGRGDYSERLADRPRDPADDRARLPRRAGAREAPRGENARRRVPALGESTAGGMAGGPGPRDGDRGGRRRTCRTAPRCWLPWPPSESPLTARHRRCCVFQTRPHHTTGSSRSAPARRSNSPCASVPPACVGTR